jgi:hypothetical protein
LPQADIAKIIRSAMPSAKRFAPDLAVNRDYLITLKSMEHEAYRWMLAVIRALSSGLPWCRRSRRSRLVDIGRVPPLPDSNQKHQSN